MIKFLVMRILAAENYGHIYLADILAALISCARQMSKEYLHSAKWILRSRNKIAPRAKSAALQMAFFLIGLCRAKRSICIVI